MNKDAFLQVLQGALLRFEGVQEAELVENYCLNPKLAKMGVQLSDYLKSKEVSQ